MIKLRDLKDKVLEKIFKKRKRLEELRKARKVVVIRRIIRDAIFIAGAFVAGRLICFSILGQNSVGPFWGQFVDVFLNSFWNSILGFVGTVIILSIWFLMKKFSKNYSQIENISIHCSFLAGIFF